MARRDVEAERRGALLGAAVHAIGAEGSLDVTVAAIARRAGVSPALAHHYFGAKEDLLLAAMRHLLGQLRVGVRSRLRAAEGPAARLRAVVEGCLDAGQFDGGTVFAWLSFYLHARRSPEAARLLAIYFRRLDSNLVHALLPLTRSRERAEGLARLVAAAVDGIWLRRALDPDGAPDDEEAVETVLRLVGGEARPCA